MVSKQECSDRGKELILIKERQDNNIKNYWDIKMNLEKITTVVTQMEIKMANMATKEDLTNFLETLDKKFASKTTEKIVYWLVSIILTAFATWLVYLIMRKWN